MYSTDITDSELGELKEILAQFYARKSIEYANKSWNERHLSNDIMNQWLDEEKNALIILY